MRIRAKRERETVIITLCGEVGRSLAARLAALLPVQPSPFVTQSQLIDLVKADRSDIERHVRQAEWMMRHPQRGMSAAPYPLPEANRGRGDAVYAGGRRRAVPARRR